MIIDVCYRYLKIYKNIHTIELLKIAVKCDYVITDINGETISIP
jgi:hypothetical protein